MKFGKIKTGIVCALSVATVVSALCACGDKDSAKKYTVEFDTRGGSNVASLKLQSGAKVNRPKNIPTKEMFIFDDWYTDTTYTEKFEFGSKMPAHNITIYAGWIGETSVTVTFDANGGSFADSDTTAESIGIAGETFAAPEANPVNFGYIFGGWYSDEECNNKYDFGVYPMENLTLYAGWDSDPDYTYVSYVGNGEPVKVIPVRKGSKITEPDLFDETIVCDGWYTDNKLTNKYTFGNGAVNDFSLYATYYTDGLKFENGVVTAYVGDAKNVVVPNVYGGKNVTSIGEYAFYRSNEVSSITSVDLPATVTTLAEGAFYDCRYLVNAELTASVTAIGKNAFYNNMRLKSFGDASSVATIGEAAFLGCRALSELVLPETLLTVGEYAFSDCKMLTEVTLPSKVRVISDFMFDGCTSLEKLEIETLSLSAIHNNAFKGCRALKEVIIRSVVPATFPDVSVQNRQSPFAYSADVTVYVVADTLESYLNDYGDLDGGSLKEKFAEIR